MNCSNRTNQHYQIQCHLLEFSFPSNGSYKVNLYTNIVVEAIIALSICILNTLLIIIIVQHKMHHAPSILLILHNIIVDLLVGIMLASTWVPTLMMSIFKTHSCILFLTGLTLAYFWGVVSTGNVLFVAIDRYLAIEKPFFYKARIKGNSKLILKVIIALWVIIALLVGLSYFTPHLMLFMIFIAIFTLPIIVWTSYVYHKVYLAVRQFNLDAKARRTDNLIDHAQMKKELTLAKATAVMIVTLFICYTPFTLTSIIWLVKPSYFSNNMYAITLWVLTFLTAKSLVTPLLLTVTLPSIKKHLKRLLMGKKIDTK